MSNPIKSSECIYPECGPTCRKNCPPLPTKPEPIEPTEEQWKTVFDVIDGNWMDGPSEVMRQVARLLAEREAKLRARVAELEAKIADAVFSCPGCGRHDFGFFASQIKAACGPCRTRAEVAEAREAQHLADIKALHQFLADHEEEEGMWIPRSEFKDIPARKYLLVDDAKADAPAVVDDTEGGEG